MLHHTLACALFRTAVMAVFLVGYPCLKSTATAAGAAPVPAKEKRVSPANAAAPIDFPTIVEKYGPAVVNISTTAQEQQTSAPAVESLDPDDPLFAFFKRTPQQPQESQGNPPGVLRGAGSGFIVSPDGLILTTAHVVDQADEIIVRLTDRREFKAKVLAVDAQSDVAVIQIDATKLPTVKLGDSSRVRVGEQVLTIGSPDRFQNTVTAGIVSATSRTLPDGSNFPFFQTDVSVNPDNSGGPLFNRAGEVIGIDVQIYSDSDRYTSLTFAIPISVATKVRSQLQTQRKVPPGGLGVEVQDVGPGLAVAFGLPRPAGALVNSVAPGTPAAAMGIKPGDVIVQLGDKTIDRSAELVEDAASLQPGTKITLRLFRNRRPVTMTVTVGTSGESPNARPTEGGATDRLGLIMHPLSEGERRASGLAVGLMVDEVHGPAAAAGIQPGDIVLSLNGTLVESQEQVAALEAKAAKEIAVLIQRNNARSFVSVELR
ncbi:trypsin-like peptidase domain-containing protein [Paraburkholderia sediminicola]|uniref:trypsin-like peptidase domain-containing protein n=1 Tax=Paraburkholderia sediminicola TaxID=458836 RepID=UPI0038BB60E8